MKRRVFIKSGLASAALAGISVPGLTFQRNEGKSIVEAERAVDVAGEYDVIVCGSGPAGISAAIGAGRSGAKVLLLETRGCLGGVWTAGLLTWILDQSNKPGLMREIENRLAEIGGKCPIDTGAPLAFDPEKMKLLLEEMCIEANVDFLLHIRVVSAVLAGGLLTHVVTESKSGREAWKAKVFVDATGDGDLSALSGCGYDVGSPADGSTQPMSMLALIGGIHFDEITEFSHRRGANGKKLLLPEIIRGGVVPSYRLPSLFPVTKDLFMMMANHEYGVSGLNTRDVTKATVQGRREVHRIIDALKSLGGKWKDLQIVATAEHIGVREGRRIHGLYTVSQDDVVTGANHSDAVCRVTFPIDVHSLQAEHEGDPKGYNQGLRARPYDIPLRALIAKDRGNLIMAGRCISGDFIAHSSYRVTGNAVAMGQAAGRLAAQACKKNLLPKEVPFGQLGITS